MTRLKIAIWLPSACLAILIALATLYPAHNAQSRTEPAASAPASAQAPKKPTPPPADPCAPEPTTTAYLQCRLKLSGLESCK